MYCFYTNDRNYITENALDYLHAITECVVENRREVRSWYCSSDMEKLVYLAIFYLNVYITRTIYERYVENLTSQTLFRRENRQKLRVNTKTFYISNIYHSIYEFLYNYINIFAVES